jgi:membrane fusion protein (multidrug efflux system)
MKTAFRRSHVLPLALGALVLGVGAQCATSMGHEKTRDAQVEAEVVEVPARATGVVAQVFVAENQPAKEGQLLALLDDQVAEARLAEAEAELEAARVSVHVADADLRIADQRAPTSTKASYVDQARVLAAAARAQVATAEAARDLAAIDVSFTLIAAPRDGVVLRSTLVRGQAVASGQPVVKLAAPGGWVTARFDGKQVERMHAGQAAEIRIAAYPDAKVHGQVESIQHWRATRTVPVRIRISSLPPGVDLRPGMAASVDVSTLER